MLLAAETCLWRSICVGIGSAERTPQPIQIMESQRVCRLGGKALILESVEPLWQLVVDMDMTSEYESALSLRTQDAIRYS